MCRRGEMRAITLIESFLQSRAAKNCRPKTISWYGMILYPFARDFPELPARPEMKEPAQGFDGPEPCVPPVDHSRATPQKKKDWAENSGSSAQSPSYNTPLPATPETHQSPSFTGRTPRPSDARHVPSPLFPPGQPEGARSESHCGGSGALPRRRKRGFPPQGLTGPTLGPAQGAPPFGEGVAC